MCHGSSGVTAQDTYPALPSQQLLPLPRLAAETRVQAQVPSSDMIQLSAFDARAAFASAHLVVDVEAEGGADVERVGGLPGGVHVSLLPTHHNSRIMV